MADYPKQYIEKLDAQCTKEGGTLLGLYALDMVATIVGLYIVGMIANSIL